MAPPRIQAGSLCYLTPLIERCRLLKLNAEVEKSCSCSCSRILLSRGQSDGTKKLPKDRAPFSAPVPQIEHDDEHEHDSPASEIRVNLNHPNFRRVDMKASDAAGCDNGICLNLSTLSPDLIAIVAILTITGA